MLSLNPSDVIAVRNNVMPYLIGLAIVLAVLLLVIIFVQKVKKPERGLIRKLSGIAMLRSVIITANLVAQGPVVMLLTLISAEGSVSEASSDSASALCTEIAEEGIVLEQNDNNLLPLQSGSKLNVFGWGSVSPV